MFKFILLFVTLLAVCQGDVQSSNTHTASSQRFGNSNRYYYYSNAKRNPDELTSADFPPTSETEPQKPFDNDWDIVVIIHGHEGSATTTVNPMVKDAFLTKGDFNIIVVDWATFSMNSYEIALMAITGVAPSIATFLQSLKLPLDKMHIVGFNLGAHVAGIVGRTLGGGVARITGLDPSSRNWDTNSLRLSQSDAQYVEVIHTDGTGVNSNGLGIAIGDMDFFVNGRAVQPGCTTNLCNHNRAYELFAASITHGGHFGNQCNTDLEITLNTCRGFTVEMGTERLVKHGSGMFRVNTGMTYPYLL